jgi:hypothetical protein
MIAYALTPYGLHALQRSTRSRCRITRNESSSATSVDTVMCRRVTTPPKTGTTVDQSVYVFHSTVSVPTVACQMFDARFARKMTQWMLRTCQRRGLLARRQAAGVYIKRQHRQTVKHRVGSSAANAWSWRYLLRFAGISSLYVVYQCLQNFPPSPFTDKKGQRQ